MGAGKRYVKTMAVLMVTLLMPARGGAQTENPQQPEAFAQTFVDALRSKQPERRLEVIHSRSRACINPQTRPYYDWIFTRQEKYAIPGHYKTTIMPLRQDAPLPGDGQSAYPVHPTHQMQIDFDAGAYKSVSMIVLIAREGTRWREVLACPTGDAVARARISAVENAERGRKAQMLVRQMPGLLRAELMELLKAGRRVDAIRRYAAASGEDITTARSVIDRMTSAEQQP